MTQREKQQAHLAKMRAADDVWARQFGRVSKYAEVMSEGHDSGAQRCEGRPDVGGRSLFRQVTGTNGVVGVTK